MLLKNAESCVVCFRNYLETLRAQHNRCGSDLFSILIFSMSLKRDNRTNTDACSCYCCPGSGRYEDRGSRKM